MSTPEEAEGNNPSRAGAHDSREEEGGQHARFLNRRIKHWFEDLFILALIILNVMDFLEVMPGDLDIIKRLLSWVMLGYLIYHVNIAKILFGRDSHEDPRGVRIGLEPRDVDLLILIGYFSLLFKNMVHFASVMVEEYKHALHEEGVHILSDFSHTIMQWLVDNSSVLNQSTLIMGGFMLLVVSIYAAAKFDIRSPSVMHIIHEEGDPAGTVGQFLVRLASIYLIILAFYILVFNFIMEWLAFAVDAPIAVLGIVFYIYVILRSHKRFDPESLLYRIGNFGENFYKRFLELFYTKQGLFLGLTGLLILHLLTDIGNFIVPHILGIHDSLYFSKLEAGGHVPLFGELKTLFGLLGSTQGQWFNDLSAVSSFWQFLGLAWVYLFNAVGSVLLMVAPAYIWYKVYVSKGFSVSRWVVSAFFVSVTVLVTGSLFRFEAIPEGAQRLVGVDITTQSFMGHYPYTPLAVMGLSLLVGVVVFSLTYSHALKESLLLVAISVNNLFVGYYVFFFARDSISGYITLLSQPLTLPLYFYLGLFALLSLGFYIGSYGLYLKETYYEFHYIR